MATPNVGKAYPVTTDDNGETLQLGDASSSRTSAKTIYWVADLPVIGDGFVIVARPCGPAPDKDGAPFVPIPYRRINLAGTASDRAITSTSLPIEGFLIEVPATGLAIGIIPSLTVGGGTLYSWDSVGSST